MFHMEKHIPVANKYIRRHETCTGNRITVSSRTIQRAQTVLLCQMRCCHSVMWGFRSSGKCYSFL